MKQPDHAPLVLFVGIEEKSRIIIDKPKTINSKAGTTVWYGAGEVVIMHGYMPHKGCAYLESNVRIYFNARNKGIKQKNMNQRN